MAEYIHSYDRNKSINMLFIDATYLAWPVVKKNESFSVNTFIPVFQGNKTLQGEYFKLFLRNTQDTFPKLFSCERVK